MTKILIVEDKEGISETMAALLEAKGYEVIGHVGLGKEALDILSRERPDIVILDILLPDMDSKDLYNKAKMLYPNLKILFITSLREERAKKIIGEERAKEIMYKPFNIDSLMKRIEEKLGNVDQ